jgi:hypothetical protein
MASFTLALAGCGALPVGSPRPPAPLPEAAALPPEVPAPAAVPPAGASPPPPRAARTPEQFDTTTPAERTAAAEAPPPAAAETRLGTTVASLGDPADPGFWAETPLVATPRPGRLEFPGTGKSVLVELRPSGGPAGSGTRVSLPALRVLGAPLTALPELVVYGL